ncbi:tRNA (cytidine(56)-2'-O)-methyltransferase [Candidatus Micrarchaeota archaeon]|nr:tRNA (cytidine(56)-2'-O)-methyltransferase [Candidatus Micrarchaeota archaeon]
MIIVLRLGHRIPRDERISTHVCLVARAFGAEKVVYAGQHDSSLEESVERIKKEWGGEFSIEYSKNGIKTLKKLKNEGFEAVHLTMYGVPAEKKIKEIRKQKKLVVVVGGSQVPKEFYEESKWNVSITGQPHSEVAALAVMLDRIYGGEELEEEFEGRFKGKIKIIPSEKGKNVKRV